MSEQVQKRPQSILDEAWDDVVGGFEWLKSVLIGEFADNRPLSAVVADMLVSFVPGVVIVTSARDAVAVTLRLADRPEKREELMEWVLLCACLITLALPLVMAAGGAAAAGVGAIVGGIAGSELGAALRAVMLMLIKQATKLVELVKFLQKFITGDILKFLRALKFAHYEKALLQALEKITGKLIGIVQSLRAKLLHMPSIDYVRNIIAKLSAWERKFYAVQQDAVRQVPRALAELQLRLDKVLAETLPKEAHTVSSGVKAEKPVATAPVKQEVADVPGRVLAKVEDTKPTAKAAEAKPASKPKADAPQPRKEKPEPPKKTEEGKNTKKQETLDPRVANERERISALSREASDAQARGDTALATAKTEEARSILRPYLPKKPGDSWDEIVKRLDVSSPKDGAVFWSGNAQAAKDYAKSIGGVTLETTPGGRIIDGWDEVNKGYPWNGDYGPPPWTSDLWKAASENYANGANGVVNIVQPAEKLWDPRTIWHNQEKPLIKNRELMGQVSAIKIHVLDGSLSPKELPTGYVDQLLKFKPKL